tara:strand:+ start:1196 stop:1339 length:144 start_codon:yes stop_codon:yes gene_type:complete
MIDYNIFINGKLSYSQVFPEGTTCKEIQEGIAKDLPSTYKVLAVKAR